jgi:hypothetical protein
LPAVGGSRSGELTGAGMRVSGYTIVRDTHHAPYRRQSIFPSKWRIVLEADNISEAV